VGAREPFLASGYDGVKRLGQSIFGKWLKRKEIEFENFLYSALLKIGKRGYRRGVDCGFTERISEFAIWVQLSSSR
jgi:hypothetical protein